VVTWLCSLQLRNTLTALTLKTFKCEHLGKLVLQFRKYFNDSDEWRCDSKWILLLFSDDGAAGSSLTTVCRRGSAHRDVHTLSQEAYVWYTTPCEVLDKLPDRTSRAYSNAVRCLLPFPITHLCESGFSTLAYLKK